jgi:hypothetical protein
MKIMKKLLLTAGAIALVGCSNFATNLFRTEQALTGSAYTAYVAYTNGLASGTIKPSMEESNSIKSARIHFAASVLTVEGWRQAYATNSAVQPQAQAALTGLIEDSSNVVYLINLVRAK